MKKRRRLLWQLYSSYLLITLISLVAVTWYASKSLRHFFLKQTALDLEARAYLFTDQILEYLDPLDEKGIDLLCKKAGERASTRITIILPSGKVAGDSEKDPTSMDTHLDRPEVLQALIGRVGTSIRYSTTLERRMMYAGVPIKKNSQILAIARTSIPVNTIDDVLRNIQNKIAVGGLIIAALAAILSLLVSRRITRPVEQIKRWAGSIAHGEFHLRPPVAKSEEIGGLSDALNQMAIDVTNVAALDVEPGTLPETMAAWVIRQEREGQPSGASTGNARRSRGCSQSCRRRSRPCRTA